MDPTIPSILQPPGPTIDTAAIVGGTGAAIMALTQLAKRYLPGEGWGPLVGALLSAIAVALWLYSQPEWPPARTATWGIVLAWIAVFGTASGLYSLGQIPTGGPGLAALFRRRTRPRHPSKARESLRVERAKRAERVTRPERPEHPVDAAARRLRLRSAPPSAGPPGPDAP